MNIVVCIKQAPEVTDADLEIRDDGLALETDDLVFDINEWDHYAVEEAVRLREAHGGTVRVVTIGDDECEEVLRKALAMGADEAFRVDGGAFEGSDATGVARGLEAAIRELPFDLILTGVQSSDDGWGQVGVTLAEILGLPWAALAVQIEIEERHAIVHRELESNRLERVELPLPGLVTVQTGINVPRYVSVMGIRKVRGVEIRQTTAAELGLPAEEIGPEGSAVASRQLFAPERGEHVEMLTGSVDEMCEVAARIIRDRGGVT